MKAILLLLAIWPFNRHPKPEPTVLVPYSLYHLPEECDRADDGAFLYLGNDGKIGLSMASCEAAFQDWKHDGSPRKLSVA